MNSTERNMLEILKELKEVHNVHAIKAEFEAEGSRLDELIRLNEIVCRADMNLIIKIGGCEAVRDLDQTLLLGAAGVMAPMIESPFAMSKFKGSAQKVYGDRLSDMDWIINAETKTFMQNMEEIFDEAEGFLKTIAIGRVDLSASKGLTRDDINGAEMLRCSQEIAKSAKKRGLTVGFGGGISFEAIPFIQQMDGLADRFETRKVVFKMQTDEKKLKQGIFKAMQFEMNYLKNKCDFYGRMANEDFSRMKMMEKRLVEAETLL